MIQWRKSTRKTYEEQGKRNDRSKFPTESFLIVLFAKPDTVEEQEVQAEA